MILDELLLNTALEVAKKKNCFLCPRQEGLQRFPKCFSTLTSYVVF